MLHAACRNCTNIIGIRGFNIYLGRFALVFDLADGPPTWMQPGGGVQCTPVELYRAVRFLWQALQGLEDMHGLGVVHRYAFRSVPLVPFRLFRSFSKSWRKMLTLTLPRTRHESERRRGI